MDSIALGREIDKRAAATGRTMEILVEVNSGREAQKAGVMPDDAEALVRSLAALPRLRVLGLMTMGPFEGDPEDSRPSFKETRRVWDAIKSLAIPGARCAPCPWGCPTPGGRPSKRAPTSSASARPSLARARRLRRL